MGGPSSFVPRRPDQLDEIPALVDAFVAIASGTAAAVAVAPFLMCVDRAVVAAAAGTAPGGSLFRAIAVNAGEFVKFPRVAFSQKSLWMVAGVYASTFAAANLSDVASERTPGVDPGVHAGGKFVATTGANMACGVLKDVAFARMYGTAAVGAASAGAAVSSKGTTLVVPAMSYALFALRDCLTIGGAFFVPPALAATLVATGSTQDETTAVAASQLISPPLMQILCTPLHLMALDLVNNPVSSSGRRIAALFTSSAASALLARSLRMLPAYGIGGLLNANLCRVGRARSARYASGEMAGEEWDVAIDGWDGRRVGDEEEDGDDLFGDDYGERALHAMAFALHGGVHPVALATKVTDDPLLWKFRWERLIQRSVSNSLQEYGGDTFGGCVVVGGDADVDESVNAFVKRLDSNGDGLLDVGDIHRELVREKNAGEGWAAKALIATAGSDLAKQFVDAADADGDRKVSAEEIKKLLRESVARNEK